MEDKTHRLTTGSGAPVDENDYLSSPDDLLVRIAAPGMTILNEEDRKRLWTYVRRLRADRLRINSVAHYGWPVHMPTGNPITSRDHIDRAFALNHDQHDRAYQR